MKNNDRTLKKRVILFLLIVATFLPVCKASPIGIPVLDSSNLSMKMMGIAMQIKQMISEVTTQYNTMKSMENQARQVYQGVMNLKNLNFNNDLFNNFKQVQNAMDNAKGVANDYGKLQSEVDALFPERSKYKGMFGNDQMKLQKKWAENNLDTARDTMNVMAQLRDLTRVDTKNATAINAASRYAGGAKAAIQATNELLSLQTKQMNQLQSIAAAQARMDAVALAEKQARAQMSDQIGKDFYKDMSKPGKRHVMSGVTL